jgi:hypothetical protein
MMRLRRASVIATLSLLAWAATASADCSWIMWSQSITKGMGSSYDVELARASRQECVAEVRETGATMKEKGYTVSGGGPTRSEVIGRMGDTTFKYFCLPDTVDPREPKGK